VKKLAAAIGASSAGNALMSQAGSFNAPLATIGAAFHQKVGPSQWGQTRPGTGRV
jgi:hypothetical protein